MWTFPFLGVYADLDLEALKPLDNWTYSQHCILPEETYAHPFLLNKLRRANTMITLLACRPHHPYFKLTMDNLSIYPKLKSSQKLLYVDDMYLKYNHTKVAHERPENEIYLAHPKYFLPTYDPGWTSKFKGDNNTVKDLRGARGTRPEGSRFFQFHAVFVKIWQNRMLAPSEGWRLHLGKILDPLLE